LSPRSNPAVIFGSLLLPSIAGRSSFHNGPLEPVNLCRPKGYCLGGRPSHLIFVERRFGELRTTPIPRTPVNNVNSSVRISQDPKGRTQDRGNGRKRKRSLPIARTLP